MVAEYQPSPRITPQEYYEIDQASEIRHELIDGQIYALTEIYGMAGASTPHNHIAGNAFGLLHAQLRGKSCAPFNQDQRLKVKPFSNYYFPDLMVACPPFEWDDELQHTLLNAKVIIEVLSVSTEHKDRVAKWFAYQRIESLTDYLMIHQNERRIEHYSRQGESGWHYQTIVENEGEVLLASIDCKLVLSEVYERVE
jgi:Uma2 family endonuclease